MGLTSTPLEQAIFTLGIDADAISVYLCCCGLAAEGVVLDRDVILSVWNDTEAAFDAGLTILEARNIVAPRKEDGKRVWDINPSNQWMQPV